MDENNYPFNEEDLFWKSYKKSLDEDWRDAKQRIIRSRYRTIFYIILTLLIMFIIYIST